MFERDTFNEMWGDTEFSPIEEANSMSGLGVLPVIATAAVEAYEQSQQAAKGKAAKKAEKERIAYLKQHYEALKQKYAAQKTKKQALKQKLTAASPAQAVTAVTAGLTKQPLLLAGLAVAGLFLFTRMGRRR